MNSKKGNFAELAYVMGMILCPLGVCLSAKSGFGVSMVVAPAYVLYLRISETLPWFTFGKSEYIFQGLLLILFFSHQLGWLPSGGSGGIVHLILPALALGAGQAGSLTRITRSSMLDVIRQDYLRTARAKGVSEKMVIRKHALKNALIPIITVFGSTLGNLLGGAVAIETVFSWPGIGRLTVSAINTRDITLATGCIIMFTVLLTVTMLLVDIAYAYVDPRIKAQYSK